MRPIFTFGCLGVCPCQTAATAEVITVLVEGTLVEVVAADPDVVVTARGGTVPSSGRLKAGTALVVALGWSLVPVMPQIPMLGDCCMARTSLVSTC